jgi:uncharacterized protein YhaN
MRFDYLKLGAFGHFTDYELTFDKRKNFHLLYGPNEAGKSTVLNSITHFLYGFPQQTNFSFLHQNTKLRIEGQLRQTDGECLSFIRRKGNKKTALGLDGTEIQEGKITDFLNGMNEVHFKNMFALDHERLREGGESLLQSGGSLGESLFSAASGISMLRKIFEEFEKKAGELYKKRGSSPELNKLLKEEKDLKKTISELQLKVQAWKDLEKRYNKGKLEIEDMIKEVRFLRSEQERLQRVKLTLPKIAKLRELASKLAELGEVPNLPDNIEELRKENLQLLESAKKMRKKATESQELLQKDMKEIAIPEGLLEHASLIEALYRDGQSYQKNIGQVPILEGEYRQIAARVITLMKEIDLKNAELTKMDLYRLSAEKKETIKRLCKQRPLLDQAFEKYEKEQKEKEVELEEKVNILTQISDYPNIDELEAVIDSVKRAGDFEESLETLKFESDQKWQQINIETKQLALWDGTYQELIELPVPGLIETIHKYDQEHSVILQSLHKINDQIQTQNELIELSKARIRELESFAEIPSEETLKNARENREFGWKLIRIKLKDGMLDEKYKSYTRGQEIETVYEESVRTADHVSDKMRQEAAKVGEKNKLLADIAGCQNKIESLEMEKNRYEAELERWESSWHELWKPSTIIPLTPAEMVGWLGRLNQIKDLGRAFEKDQLLITEMESRKLRFKHLLIKELSKYESISEEKTVDELLRIAEKHFKKFRDEQYKRSNLQSSILDVKGTLEKINSEKKDLESKIEIWKSEWIKAVEETNISIHTPAEVAESLLEIYEDCTRTYDQMIRIEKEKIAIQEQISLFEGRVREILMLIHLELDNKNIQIAVNQLYDHLQKAQKSKVKLTALLSQLDILQNDIRDADREINESEEILSSLMKLANCQTHEVLEQVENTFRQKKEIQSSIFKIEEELLELGNGQSLKAIIQEADQIDHDSIEAELEEIKRKLEEIEPIRSQIEQAHGVMKKEFEEKILGNNTASVSAEQQKESILAKLANLTDQYVQLKLASSLLKRGIEHYRNQNQDPILKRACLLFERLTLQSFSGLIVDYDDKDQPVLMGIRANGEKVPIDGMSDGTTDQLYLSLRIASIEKYVDENEPIPFIVDDILVHFDDSRSKVTLKILVELSQKTQVIFFTHHNRLVEIMKEIAHEKDYQLTKIGIQEPVVI